jgi:arylsulfatase A-like enzyme
MFLRPLELVPLYATEWLMVACFGLAAAGLCCLVDVIVSRWIWRRNPGFASRIGFAAVIAIALFFGVYAWIASFTHTPLTLGPRLYWLIACICAAGAAAALGFLTNKLLTLAKLARILSLAGAVTLVSLVWVANGKPPSTGGHAAAAGQPPRPNIVLITIDTLAASHLGLYGYVRPTSPNIDELGSRSTVYDHFHSNSNFTTTGIATILTGVAPWTHRVLQLQGKAAAQWIADSFPARLQEAGYQTAYFGSNTYAGGRFQGVASYFDYKDSELDWAFGPCFDRFADFAPYLCATAENGLIAYSYLAFEHAAARLGLISIFPHSDVQAMVGRVARWCKTVDKQRAPIFLWVHFFPPHDPYAAPRPWLGRFDSSAVASSALDSGPAVHFAAQFDSAKRIETLAARYDESIAFVDHYVGDLIASVNRQFGPNTAIILTADHGESFHHGYGSHGGVMLYEDLIHIPLIVSLPDGHGERREDLASQVDIAPTIAAIARVAPSPDWVGQSLLGPPDTTERTIFSMNFEENVSRRQLTTGAVAALRSEWKFVTFFGDPKYPDEPPLHSKLFDLQTDPNEERDVSGEHPDVSEALSEEIARQMSLNGGPIAP